MMAPTDPTTWSLFTWWLWMMGLYYLIGFFIHWFRFRRLQRDLDREAPGAMKAWNRGISGWPAMGYAKMLGRRKLVSDDLDGGYAQQNRSTRKQKMER